MGIDWPRISGVFVAMVCLAGQRARYLGDSGQWKTRVFSDQPVVVSRKNLAGCRGFCDRLGMVLAYPGWLPSVDDASRCDTLLCEAADLLGFNPKAKVYLQQQLACCHTRVCTTFRLQLIYRGESSSKTETHGAAVRLAGDSALLLVFVGYYAFWVLQPPLDFGSCSALKILWTGGFTTGKFNTFPKNCSPDYV